MVSKPWNRKFSPGDMHASLQRKNLKVSEWHRAEGHQKRRVTEEPVRESR